MVTWKYAYSLFKGKSIAYLYRPKSNIAIIMLEEKYHIFQILEFNSLYSCLCCAQRVFASMKARQLNPSNPSFVRVDKADHARNIQGEKK